MMSPFGLRGLRLHHEATTEHGHAFHLMCYSIKRRISALQFIPAHIDQRGFSCAVRGQNP